MEEYQDLNFDPLEFFCPLVMFNTVISGLRESSHTPSETQSTNISRPIEEKITFSELNEEKSDFSSSSAERRTKGVKPPKKLALKAHWIYIRRRFFSKLFDCLNDNMRRKLRSKYNQKNQSYSKSEIMKFFNSTLEEVLTLILNESVDADTITSKERECIECEVRKNEALKNCFDKSIEALYFEDGMQKDFMKYIKPKKNKSISLLTYSHLSLRELADALQTRRPQLNRNKKSGSRDEEEYLTC